MAHNPVNHPLRPLYRALSALAGVYLALFGIVGLIVTPGNGLFGQPDDRVLGQGANLFWSIVSLILGAIVLVGVVIGMAQGKDITGARSQDLMRKRVMFQAIAIVFVILFLLLASGRN